MKLDKRSEKDGGSKYVYDEKSGKQTTGMVRTDTTAKVTDAQLGSDPYSLEIRAIGAKTLRLPYKL